MNYQKGKKSIDCFELLHSRRFENMVRKNFESPTTAIAMPLIIPPRLPSTHREESNHESTTIHPMNHIGFLHRKEDIGDDDNVELSGSKTYNFQSIFIKMLMFSSLLATISVIRIHKNNTNAITPSIKQHKRQKPKATKYNKIKLSKRKTKEAPKWYEILTPTIQHNTIPIFFDSMGGSSFVYHSTQCSSSNPFVKEGPTKFIYTNSLCDISKYLNPNERGHLLMIVRNPSAKHTYKPTRRRKNNRNLSDITSVFNKHSNPLTRAITCKKYKVTIDDYRSAKSVIIRYATTLHSFPTYKNAVEMFYRKYFTSSKRFSPLCVIDPIMKGRGDRKFVGNFEDSLRDEFYKFDSMLYNHVSLSS